MIQLPEKNHTERVQLSPDVSFRWMFEGRVIELIITKSTQAAIDIYAEANLAALKLWTPGQRFYSLQDVSHPDVTITPYFRKRLDDVLAGIHESGLQGDSVIVLSNSISGKIVQTYGILFARKAGPIKQHWSVGYERGFAELKKLLAN